MGSACPSAAKCLLELGAKFGLPCDVLSRIAGHMPMVMCALKMEYVATRPIVRVTYCLLRLEDMGS